MPLLLLAVVAMLQQSTPTGGSITRFVPPVPTPESFISDQRAVLTPAQRQTLDARITGIQQAGLGDIAVAILPSIGDHSPNQMAVEVYRTWKVGRVGAVGSAQRNLGVLLLVVPKELAPDNKGHCWINTGTGGEGIVTDATAGSICRDSVIPHLRDKDYAGAIGAGISGIEARLRGDTDLAAAAAAQPGSGPGRNVDEGSGDGLKVVLGLGSLAGLLLAVFGVTRWRRYRTRKCPRCGKPMRRLDERSDNAKLKREEALEEKLGSIDYDVWDCACGHALVLPYRAMFSKYSECKSCKRRTASSKRSTVTAATTAAAGLAIDRFACKACSHAWEVRIVLPRIDGSASSGGGSSSGGGGGSSFGGSGSTAGGGGGGSY